MVFLIKKFIIIALVAALILPCFVFSASAETFNYLDYITHVEVDGERNIVTVDLPCSSNRYDIWDPLDSDGKVSAFAPSITHSFLSYDSTGYDYDINFSPSWDGKKVNTLSLINIPNGTEVNIWLNVESHIYGQEGSTIDGVVTPRVDFDWQTAGARFQYFYEGNRVATELADFDLWDTHPVEGENNYTFEFYCTGELRDPTQDDNTLFIGVDSFYPTFYLNNCRFNYDMDLTFSIVRYQLVLHIEQLLIGGEYDRLLESINRALLQTGKKIDEITGNVVYVPLPPESEIIDENAKLEEIILELGGEAFGDSEKYMEMGSIAIAERSPAFLAVSSLLNRFIDIPFFNGFIVLGIGIGVFGFSVNLAFSISRYLSNRSDSGSKSKDKSGSKSG